MSALARRLPPGPATLADLLAIPEEIRRHELIDGEIVEKATPTFEHGAAQLKMGEALGPFHRRSGPPGHPGGWWLASEVEVYFDPENTPRPDVVGWRRERVPERPRGTPVRIIPDWICEVLSTNRRNDLVRKKRLYHLHRVSHYWLVDPVEETLAVHRWTADGYTEVLSALRGERVRAEPFEAVELAVGAFFGDDNDT
jgi:Uma2 family endonuclease